MATSLSEVLVWVGDDKKKSRRGEERREISSPNFFRTLSGVHPDWVKCLEAGPSGLWTVPGGSDREVLRCECGRREKVQDTLIPFRLAINRHRYLKPTGRSPTMNKYTEKTFMCRLRHDAGRLFCWY